MPEHSTVFVDDAVVAGRTVTVTHRTTMAAPLAQVYRLVADTEAAPRFFPPQLHSEILRSDGDADVVRRWVFAGGAVRAWNARRELDPVAGRIVFSHENPEPPVRSQRGEWRFSAAPGEGTLIELTHTVAADVPEVAERIAADLDRTGPMQLAGYRKVAEWGSRRTELVVTAELSTVVGGTAADGYAALLADHTWSGYQPGEPIAVTALAGGTELLAYGTSAPVRLIRIPLSPDRLVFKVLDLPEWLGGYLGTWTCVPIGDRIEVRQQHVAVLAPAVLGEMRSARAELRERAVELLRTDLARCAAALPDPLTIA
jgi:ribosome-associated toxin RatA of RatAB toxin-antitoxin module